MTQIHHHTIARVQLGKVLAGEGIETKGQTRIGKRASMDKNALDGVDHPFVRTYLELERKKKLKSTYLLGLRREICDGFVHPVISLHLVRTHRSSASDPNIQNQLVRKLRRLRCFGSATFRGRGAC